MKTYPLNSKRLTAEVLTKVAKGLGLPTSTSLAETRQLVEGKLEEQQHEPMNVQVDVIDGATGGITVRLRGESGTILELPADETGKRSGGRPRTRSTSSNDEEPEEIDDVRDREKAESREKELKIKLERALEHARELEEELEREKDNQERMVQQLTETVSQLEEKVKGEKEKYCMLWRLNCVQLQEHDEALASKDEEIITLRARVEALEDPGRGEPPPRSVRGLSGGVHWEAVVSVSDPGRGPTYPSPSTVHEEGVIPLTAGTGLGDVPLTVPSTRITPALGTARDRSTRRGQAPPVDPFTGEDPEVRLEDWLPALTRAAEWNMWTPAESLMQMAGYLRGRALQEWRLLDDEVKKDWKRAVTALHTRLDPGNKVLAAQDFRHTIQEEKEGVADFIRQLERTFRIAYGKEHFMRETRKALLFGQLQDGLRPELMQNATVVSALTYQDLCMAARTEEQRKAEMRKRRQYRSLDQGMEDRDQKKVYNRSKRSDPLTKNDAYSRRSNSTNHTVTTDPEKVRTCYNFGQPGHLAKYCQAPKSESQGRSSITPKKVSPKTKKVTTQETGNDIPRQDLKGKAGVRTPPDLEDPHTYLPSDAEEGDVKLIQVQDEGSQPQCAPVQIGGVPALGIIDSGADITIIGKQLFLSVAAATKMKKKECKRPDRVPKTYDRKPFALHGMLELEIAFDGRKMATTVYVKMDACDQLLLSEGVCRQLGILQYHPSVQPYGGLIESESGVAAQPGGRQLEPKVTAIVPTVRVKLLHSCSIQPFQRVAVQVKMDRSVGLPCPLMLEPRHLMDGIIVEPSLLEVQDGIGCLEVTNHTGCTQQLHEGEELGTAMEATLVTRDHQDQKESLLDSVESTNVQFIKRVRQEKSAEWRSREFGNYSDLTCS